MARGDAQDVGKLFNCQKRVTADQVEHLIVTTDTRILSMASATRCTSTMRRSLNAEQLADLGPVQSIARKSSGCRLELESLNEPQPGEPARSYAIHIRGHNEKAHRISAIFGGRREQFEEPEQSRLPPGDR